MSAGRTKSLSVMVAAAVASDVSINAAIHAGHGSSWGSLAALLALSALSVTVWAKAISTFGDAWCTL